MDKAEPGSKQGGARLLACLIHERGGRPIRHDAMRCDAYRRPWAS